jgi:NADH-quinone oxidoreductase subunit F
MPLHVTSELAGQIDEVVSHYPEHYRRAPVLWVLHLLQDHYGFLGPEQVEWAAARLGVPPVDVWELVSFYPMFAEEPRGRFHFKVCRSLSCELGGCRGILERVSQRLGLQTEQTSPDGRFTISTFECLADCGNGPVLMVNDELFEHLTPEKLDEILDRILQSDRLDPQPLPPVQPPHPLERRVLLAGLADPGYDASLAGYLHRGGYQALRRALDLGPQAVVQEVLKSELRGRGGAGFPTGRKWSFVDQKSSKPIYLVCNGDESEPGTFKDRVLVHHAPHLLLEGMLISCYALGAHTAYIYLRGEFPKAVDILATAVSEARAQGLLGRDILGRGFDCEVYLHRGAGAYICGEETGLIESLEGKRAYPRIKPPFPAVHGLFGCPTAVNNVETLCNVPAIVSRGADWYLQLGVAGSRGTRIVCVSGRVRQPGYYEFEMGKLTLRQLVYDVCGGPLPGRTLKGVIPGGSSMPVLTPDQLDVTLDFDAIQKAGSMAGSGGVIVLDDATDVVGATLNVARFYAHESCGQCTPCREGTLWMEKILQRMATGQGRPQDPALLAEIADNIEGKTICPLGVAVAWPVKAFTTKYAGEFATAVAPRATAPEGQ